MTIYKFNIWFDADPECKQERYVYAMTATQAIEKLEDWKKAGIANGMSNFTYSMPEVEIDFVIS